MEYARGWTICLFYFFLLDVCIFCQNVPSEVVSTSTFAPGFVNTVSKPPSESQLMSTLLSLASNGAYPERSLPTFQQIVSPENVGIGILDDRAQTFNLISFQPKIPTCNANEPIIRTPPAVISNPTSNTLFVPIQSIQPSGVSTPIPLNSFVTVPQASQAVQSYGNIVQNTPTIWQLPQPLNDGRNCLPVNPIAYMETSPNPINLQINPPCSSLQEMNTNSGLLEILSGSNLVGVQEPNVITSERDNNGFPLNLQINLPSQNIPAPRITVVSAPPQVASTNTEEPCLFPPFGFMPPPPPLVMRKSRSSWRKMLPIILIALFNDRGCCGGGCSCCNCNPDTDNPIPIPYPIPIPVNNPIINNLKSSCSSRKRGQRDDEDNKAN